MSRPVLPAVGDLALTNWGQKIIDAINSNSDKADTIGSLSSLLTTQKGTIVDAINEVYNRGGTGSGGQALTDGSVTDAKVASNAAISLNKTADTTDRVTISQAERIRLSGIPTNATANQTDTYLLNRANHTGTQSADSIVDGSNNKAYTSAEKTKLANLTSSASPTLATVPAGYIHSVPYSTAKTYTARSSITNRTDIYIRVFGQTTSDNDITWFIDGDWSQITDPS